MCEVAVTDVPSGAVAQKLAPCRHPRPAVPRPRRSSCEQESDRALDRGCVHRRRHRRPRPSAASRRTRTSTAAGDRRPLRGQQGRDQDQLHLGGDRADVPDLLRRLPAQGAERSRGAGSMLPAIVLVGAAIMAVGSRSTGPSRLRSRMRPTTWSRSPCRRCRRCGTTTSSRSRSGSIVFLLSAGISIVQTGALPKWLGWIAIVLAIAAPRRRVRRLPGRSDLDPDRQRVAGGAGAAGTTTGGAGSSRRTVGLAPTGTKAVRGG